MNSHFPKILALLFIVFLSLGAIQGNRINAIKESEIFYRWTLSAASLTRLGDTLEPDGSADIAEAMDDEVFAELDAIAETLLPDYPVDEKFDLNSDGTPRSRLLRAARQSHDDDVWKLISRNEVSDLRSKFHEFLATNQIQSSGVQFSASSLYGDASNVNGVGLTGMFFGLRTLAANFLWMQVDSFWHSGEMHRMVPLMRTCVTFDPNFIDAYLLGAWHLAYNIPAKIEPTPEPLKVYSPKYKRRVGLKEEWYYMAVDFLRDGIRKNPRDYRLYFDLGYAIYEQKLDDHPNAILYLDEARRHKHDRWVPRMLFRSLFLNKQYEDAIEGWESYLIDFPDHEVGDRFLEINRGFLAEAIADEAYECKMAALAEKSRLEEERDSFDSASDSEDFTRLNEEVNKAETVAAEMETRMNKELTTALTIWYKLLEDDRDTMARGRIARRNAIAMRQSGRYLEAIAELEIIRWLDLQFFEELSNMIIEIKKENNIPLNISEQLQVLRDEDAQIYAEDEKKKIRRLECKYLQDEA